MGTLHCITIDCADPGTMSKFWAQAMEGYSDDPSGVLIRSEAGPMMFFQQVPEGKTAKHRVHLELAAHNHEKHVERLISLGATKVQDFDHEGRQWTLMQDPEGGEFCIQQGQQETERPRLVEIVLDTARPFPVAKFWTAALEDYSVRPYDDEEIARLKSLGITDLEDDPGIAADSSSGGPVIFFQTVPEPKTAKNRIHIDLGAPEVQPEVERLAALGATVVQAYTKGPMQWTVMLDPAGNEFCVCRA
jgi:hypothetical protein